MNKKRAVKALLAVACGVSLMALAGCGGDSTAAPSTAQEAQSFRADPSKMPPDVAKRIEQSKQGPGPGQVPPAGTK